MKEPMSLVEWLGLGWGALTFIVTLGLGLIVAPYLVANLGEFVQDPPLFSRVVLHERHGRNEGHRHAVKDGRDHPIFVLGFGSLPLASAGLSVWLGWPKSTRLLIILAGTAWSLVLGALMVIAMYLPLFSMAAHIQT